MASVAALSQDGVVATAEDVLRLLAEQATLEWQTEVLRTSLASDPFERWNSGAEDDRTVQRTVERLRSRVRVVDYHRVHTKDGYVNLQATVQLPPPAAPATAASTSPRKRHKQQNSIDLLHEQVTRHVQLHFRYERTCSTHTDSDTASSSSTVWYSIDLVKDYGPAERLLWVQVWGDGPAPAPGRAQNMEAEDDDDDEDWSDMEHDSENGDMGNLTKPVSTLLRQEETEAEKKMTTMDTALSSSDEAERVDGESQRNCPCTVASAMSNTDETQPVQPPCDRFVAGMDPDLLERFLAWTGLGPGMDDLTAFFILMTFPYYEHEWDMVGLVLDAVFGMDGDGAIDEEED